MPHEAGCIGSTARVCSELGAWVGQICAGTEPLCVPEVGSCACTPTSCAEGTICAASGRCEPPATDCPPTAPLAVGDLQDLAITRVRFDPDGSAEVLLENVTPGYVGFAALAYALCNGANNCVYLSDTDSFGLMTGDTISRRIANTLPSGGELAVVDLAPNFPLEPQVYLAWGEGAGADSFESMVNDVPPRNLQLWHTGERIVIEAGDNGFVCVGDVSLALGYESCKP